MDQSEEEKTKIREKVEKLRSSKFKQQTLPAWRPIPSFKSTMITFTVFGLIFLALGIALYVMSGKIKEVTVQYNDHANCVKKAQCTIELQITEDIEGPVYVYYQLDNFYQNHRRYVKSRSFDQLKGSKLSATEVSSDCDPIVRNRDIKKDLENLKKVKLDPEEAAMPCGLVAKSFFNDKYAINKNIEIVQKNIAWDSDREYKFKNWAGDGVKTYEDVQWLDMTDEHFIVWMRTAGLPNFRKLWGRIESGIKAGTYELSIDNNYDVSSFDGKKTFVLSTTNALGGKNYFLAICYIVVGALCIVFAIIFLIAFLKKRGANHLD